MEGVLDFLRERAAALPELLLSPRMMCVEAFLLLLLTLDLARRGWRLSWSRRAVQGVMATLAIFHINFLFLPLVWFAVLGVNLGYEWLGLPALPRTVWEGYPVWLLSILSIVVHDFANYWNHRLMHTRWFWPVHAIHHSDPDVNGLTAYRVHMLESVVMWGSYTIMLSWLGLPTEAVGLGAILLSLHIVYVHIDVDWGHGPFRLLLASPRFHRWHHADVKEAYGKNLANIFPLFDWLFGTYRVPGPCKESFGAPGVPQNDVVALMAFPLTEWRRLLSEHSSRLRTESGLQSARHGLQAGSQLEAGLQGDHQAS